MSMQSKYCILTPDHPYGMPVGDEVASRGVSVDERLPPHADEEEALVARVGEHEHGEGGEDGGSGAGQTKAEHVELGAGAAAHGGVGLDCFMVHLADIYSVF